MKQTADIATLHVTHWPKPAGEPPVPGSEQTRLAATGLFVDTCLRQLHITWNDPSRWHGGDSYRGQAAYCFLLEVATGLHSAVPGETNVFGQFQKTWRRWRETADGPVVAPLAPVMHRLINDARAIRCKHLQGIGGSSYGSLVRRLIAARSGDRVLFVGAGDLARSMLPLFRNFNVGLWNRRAVTDQLPVLTRRFAPEHGAHAACWAHHVVLTTPPDPVNDGRWRHWIAATGLRTVVHLGHRDPMTWPGAAQAFDLTDVFALRRAQRERRSLQLARARIACRDCAHPPVAGGMGKLPLIGLAGA